MNFCPVHVALLLSRTIGDNGVFPTMSCSINELSACLMAAWPPTYRQILLLSLRDSKNDSFEAPS